MMRDADMIFDMLCKINDEDEKSGKESGSESGSGSEGVVMITSMTLLPTDIYTNIIQPTHTNIIWLNI